MLKNLFLTVIAVAISAGICAAAAGRADQFNATLTIPVQKTTPVSGKQMYSSYCASCHGLNGRGNGPIASSLKTPPADLTVLSKNNGGKFPCAHITTVLQHGVQIPSHGTIEMPVWGPVLGKMDQANPQERLLRISNLSRYLESIQAR
jgi:mono/diheme cytochrome c family protein